MSEVSLQSPGVRPLIGQRIPASVAKLVRMAIWNPSRVAGALDHLGKAARREWVATSPDKAPKLKLSVAILKNRRSILIKIRLRRDYEKGDVALAAARAHDGPMPRPWFCHA